MLRCQVTMMSSYPRRVAGTMAMLLALGLGAAGLAVAQQPPVHFIHQGVMPPGAIGSQQLQRGGPLPGYFQPVQIKGPPGSLISLALNGQFDYQQEAIVRAGLLIGAVYRLRVVEIPLNPGVEVYPTIELVNRLYTPRGQERRFPVPIELTREDLELALHGKFVTRVIYLEDPDNATPAQQSPDTQSWFEVKPGDDPLVVADSLGRPMAILRIGGRVPLAGEAPDAGFLFGCPPFVRFTPPLQFVAPPAQAAVPSSVPPQEKTPSKDRPST
jgi:hypothetical protein